MLTYADLEITLRRRDEGSYVIDLSFTQPDDEADIRPLAQPPHLQLDVTALRRHHLNDEDYGQTLAAQLFGDPQVQEAFNKARTAAQSQDVPLRVRLLIDTSAIELHSLRWETLRDPDDSASTLFTNQWYYFSRYLRSADWRPIRSQAKRDLKALVLIANPADLDPARLAPVDVEGELTRATTGLGQIKTTALARVADPDQFLSLCFV